MPEDRLTLAPEFYAAALDDSPYFRFYDRSPVTRLLRQIIPQLLRPGASVLDLGCGNAIAACHLAAGGGENLVYVGIDPDRAVCEWARRVLGSLPPERVRGRVHAQTWQEFVAVNTSTFDLIVSSWAFRNCVDLRCPETHEPAAAAIAGLLAPGGALLVGDAFIAPGATEDEIERIRHCHGRLVGERGNGNPIVPPALIEDLFRRAGLVCVERRDVLALPLGRLLNIPHDRYCLQVFRRAADRVAGRA